jgi:spore maturation protein CgeB
MRIFYVAMSHDYGRPELGPSVEEVTFRSAFEGMGHDVVPFDFMTRERAVGQDRMNRELVERAAEVRPDVSFFFLFRDEIKPATIEAVAREGRAPTMNWFADDHWRFEEFSRHYAPSLDWAITTDHAAIDKYRRLGHHGAIMSQWACNRYTFDKVASELQYDVTFVGMQHGGRGEVIEKLTAEGFPVRSWGTGFPAGRLSHPAMLDVFGSSRINLGFTNSSEPPRGIRPRIGALIRGQRISRKPRPKQIKGRTFEVPGCGGFLLTEYVDHLEEYFEVGREIACFKGYDELVAQLAYWLEHPEERAAVADAGYRRVRAEHTYDHRFERIFAAAGLA